MELRELAEQILFATTLDGKLACPDIVTDEHPGPALGSPDTPGRPAELRFKSTGSNRAEFPGLQGLDNERERGRLLHFFANHELLATELMALVLLRFPEAPAAFRRGVLQTLRDEQAHTRLYVERMAECGVRFGELPVSGYFWRSIAPMESPLDFVTGLSLTFEQANLDFCRHFARGFATVGDAATAQLLERIHRDEIGHVAHGLKWFRRWKDPAKNDWDAFCRQLKFPLTPQRAKGMTLNVESRRAAGLDPAFIAELNVYSHSKGRTPGVFVFNPFTEGHLARGRAFTPVKHQAQLARDLANLPQFLGRQDDLVLLPERPSVEFLATLKDAGFPLPEFVELEPRKRSSAPGFEPLRVLSGRKLGALRPWAWGPDSAELLAPLSGQVTEAAQRGQGRNHRGLAPLYSKAWSAGFLREFLRQRNPAEAWLSPESEVGIATDSVAEALRIIQDIRRRGHHRIVVKDAFGVAGHNAIRLWEPELSESQHRWLERALQAGRQVVVEPWLDRVMDFSVQLEMTPGGLKLCGYTGLINDARGQFQANWAEPQYTRRLPVRIPALFPGTNVAGQLHRLYADIFDRLETKLREMDFLGPLGIDAFVYRTASGEIRLKPVVEINPRYTMGRLTVELMKSTGSGCHGRFRLVNLAQARTAGFADFPTYARALTERHPLRFAGEPIPRLCEGALPLNDPSRAQVCLAVFEVSRTPPVLAE